MGRCRPRVGVQRPVDDLGDAMLGCVEHVLVGGSADRAIEIFLGSGYRAAPAAQEPVIVWGFC